VRGCLFTLILGAAVIGVFVFLGLPAIAAGALTAGVAAAGLQSDDTTVTVASDPPTDLLGLHADRVRLRATDATFRGLEIGRVDLTFQDLHFVERTAAAVHGSLEDVTATGVGGRDLTLPSIEISGGGDTITATTTIPAAEVEDIIADRIEDALGARPTSVRTAAPDRLTVELVVAVKGRFMVSDSGDLQVRITNGPAAGQVVTLLDADSGLPIRLTGAAVTPVGDLELTGELTVSLLDPLPLVGS
jgi:hypothetical protein